GVEDGNGLDGREVEALSGHSTSLAKAPSRILPSGGPGGQLRPAHGERCPRANLAYPLLGTDVDAARVAWVVGQDAAADLHDVAGHQVGDAEHLDVRATAWSDAGDDDQAAGTVGRGGHARATRETRVVRHEPRAHRGH